MPRLPEILDRNQLAEDKRPVFDYLVETRGAVRGAMATLLHHPDVTYAIAQLGTQVRFKSSLSARVRELAALTASCELGGRWEKAIHLTGAREAGVPEATLRAIETGGSLFGIDEGDVLPIRAARELLREHRLSDATYTAMEKAYGITGTIELAATIGYYSLLACVFNTLDLG